MFRLPLILPGLFELPFAVRQKSPDLDRLGDLWEKYYAEAFGRQLHTGFQMSRALPAITAPKERVVPYEDAMKIAENSPPAVILPCPCRQAARNCDDPLNVCIVFGQEFYGGDVPGVPVMDPSQMVSTLRMRPAPALGRRACPFTRLWRAVAGSNPCRQAGCRCYQSLTANLSPGFATRELSVPCRNDKRHPLVTLPGRGPVR